MYNIFQKVPFLEDIEDIRQTSASSNFFASMPLGPQTS